MPSKPFYLFRMRRPEQDIWGLCFRRGRRRPALSRLSNGQSPHAPKICRLLLRSLAIMKPRIQGHAGNPKPHRIGRLRPECLAGARQFLARLSSRDQGFGSTGLVASLLWGTIPFLRLRLTTRVCCPLITALIYDRSARLRVRGDVDVAR